MRDCPDERPLYWKTTPFLRAEFLCDTFPFRFLDNGPLSKDQYTCKSWDCEPLYMVVCCAVCRVYNFMAAFFFFKHSIILFLSVHVYMYVGAGVCVCVFLLGRWKTAYLSCCAVFLCKYMQHSCDDVSLCVLFILLCSSCLQQFLLFLKCSAYLMCGCKHITALWQFWACLIWSFYIAGLHVLWI